MVSAGTVVDWPVPVAVLRFVFKDSRISGACPVGPAPVHASDDLAALRVWRAVHSDQPVRNPGDLRRSAKAIPGDHLGPGLRPLDSGPTLDRFGKAEQSSCRCNRI